MASRLLTRSFVFAFLSQMLMGLSFALFVHFAGFLVQLGADEVAIGLVIGVGSIGSLILRPFVGVLMDRIGRRPLIHVGNAINVVSAGLYLTVDTLSWWVYVLTVIHGMAEAVLFTALATYGADIIPEDRRTEGLALFGVSGQLPIALGGLVGDLVLRIGDFDLFFMVVTGFGLAAMVAALPLQEARRQTRPSGGFVFAVAQRRLQPIWLVTAGFAVAMISYFVFLKTFVDETDIGSVGVFFAVYSGTAIALRIVGARLPQKVGELRLLTVAMGAMVLGLLVLGLAPAALFVPAAVLTGGAHGYAFPILYSLVVTRSDDADRGAALSGFTSFFPLASLIGAPVMGWLIDLGGYRTMFIGVAAFAAAATLAFVRAETGQHVYPSAAR